MPGTDIWFGQGTESLLRPNLPTETAHIRVYSYTDSQLTRIPRSPVLADRLHSYL